MFQTLRAGPIALHLIEHDNLAGISELFQDWPDSGEMLAQLFRNYLPTYDAQGRRTNYGFYARLHGELAGMSVLTVDSWDELSASLGADVFQHMRGRGVTPGSNRRKAKPSRICFTWSLRCWASTGWLPGTPFPT